MKSSVISNMKNNGTYYEGIEETKKFKGLVKSLVNGKLRRGEWA